MTDEQLEETLDNEFGNNGMENAIRELTTKPFRVVLAAMREACEKEAKEFAEWKDLNHWHFHKIKDNTAIFRNGLDLHELKTTDQLYQQYLKSKQ